MHTYFRRLSHTLFASMVIVILSVISGVMSARLLGPSQKGVLTAAILWPVVLAAVGSVGVLEAITYFSARPRPSTPVVAGTGVTALLILSAALIAIGYPLIGRVLGVHGSEAVGLGRLGLVCIPLILLGTAFSSVVIGRGEVAFFNVIRCVQPLALCLGTIWLLVVGPISAGAFVAVTIVACALGCATALVFCVTVIGVEWSASVNVGRLIMTYGMKSHLGQIASMANLQLDQMMMSTFLASRTLGIYAVAVSIAGGVAMISGAAAISSFSRLAGEVDEARKLLFFGRVARVGLGLALTVASALWLGAPRLVTLLFGEAYVASVAPTRLLLIAAVPLALNTILSSGFKALNRAIIPTKAQLISLGSTIVLLPFLLPRFEAMGAAATSLVAYSVASIYLLVAVRLHCGLSPRALLWPGSSDWQWMASRLSTRGTK
jgi:O-antigen/teichoic acid export membrane protein